MQDTTYSASVTTPSGLGSLQGLAVSMADRPATRAADRRSRRVPLHTPQLHRRRQWHPVVQRPSPHQGVLAERGAGCRAAHLYRRPVSVLRRLSHILTWSL